MTEVFKAGMKCLHFTGAARLLSPFFRGIGGIFMLHSVRPGGGKDRGFSPNQGLEVTPEFLDQVIELSKQRGYQLVSLRQAAARLKAGDVSGPPFVAFTADDGFLDNFEHAWPVFRKHQCPFTIFVAPAITDGTCELWWKVLEAAVVASDHFHVDQGPVKVSLPAKTVEQKDHAFWSTYWMVRPMPEHDQRAWTRQFAKDRKIDMAGICREQSMTWDQVREISHDPLCDIGAHTINHYAVSKLTADEVMAEAVQSRQRIEDEIGVRPATFAYPYGDAGSAGARDFDIIRQAGFEAAVTTRKGLLFREHAHHLTALPRVSLGGEYQDIRYTDVLLSGVPFALWNRFQKVNAA